MGTKVVEFLENNINLTNLTDDEKDLLYSFLFKMVENTEKYFNENSKKKIKKGKVTNND